MSSSRVEVFEGRDIIVELPPIKIDGPAMVKVWTLKLQVKHEAKEYTVKELCALLTEAMLASA